MTLKNSYSKICLFLSWKFPWFYHVLSTAKFPLQVIAVCIAMVTITNVYNAHFSFEAMATSTEDAAIAGNTPNNKKTAASSEHFNNDNVAVNAQSSPSSSADELKPLQEKELQVEVLAGSGNQQSLRSGARVEPAGELLRESEDSMQDTLPVTDLEIELLTADWLQQQPENHYVAQVAAAVEPQILIDYAVSKEFKAPLVIYPFKTNKAGQLVFGLSTGLFIMQDDAMTELPVLSELSNEHGVWVRKVADIKNQLATLKRDRIVE